LELKDSESFVEKTIGDFDVEKPTVAELDRADAILGNDVKGRIQEAESAFDDFVKEKPDKSELQREIARLQKKFVERPEVVKEPKPTVLAAVEPTEPVRKKPAIKKRRNTDDFPKSKVGNPIIYNIVLLK